VESGRKSTRPQLAAALTEARKTGALLVVAKLDRLARDMELISSLVKEAERNGFGGLLFAPGGSSSSCCITTHSHYAWTNEGGHVTTTPEGELFIHQMAVFAQFEARRISQRTKAGLAVAKSRGVKLGGARGGQRAANEARQQQAVESAERLRGILAPMAAGGASLPAMASALEAAGVKTGIGKSTWAPTQVKRAVDRLGLR
jgi:DNA invertase Pin-like site-specific DNA recombinase